MKLRPASVFLVALLACPAAIFAATAAAPSAAPATTFAEVNDLGEGLGYIRVHQLADSLELLGRTLPQARALVLDVRYASATESDAATFARVLGTRTGNAPLFVLVSQQTPVALTPALLKLPAGSVTLGIAGSLPEPAVLVQQPEDVDRRAFAAFDGGMPLAALITGKIDKERFDEAELVKEFQSGNTNAAPPATPDPTKPNASAEKAPVLTDRVLQRAVHLHRALAAFKPRG